jgi:hypothetical protein
MGVLRGMGVLLRAAGLAAAVANVAAISPVTEEVTVVGAGVEGHITYRCASISRVIRWPPAR